MIRDAACQCGHLLMRCDGEPLIVSLCHCLDCQRRTGSPFGIGAFFARERVALARGSPTRFTRGAGGGAAVTFHFCGTCGSTVWWEPERVPSMVGVAVGAFADPAFPAPTRASWAVRRHGWLHLPAEVASHPRSPAPAAPRG